MYNQLLERINIDFDIKNHRELSPYVFFTDVPLLTTLKSKFNHCDIKDYHHGSVLFSGIEEIESTLNRLKYNQNDKEKIEDIFKPFVRTLRFMMDLSDSSSSIENLFSIQTEVVNSLINDSQYFISKLKKIIKRNLMQMPLSTALFPHYRQLTTNYFFYDDNTLDENSNVNNNNIEQKLTEIIDNSIKENKMISIDDLSQILNILSGQTKIFSFSPTFILATIDKFNSFFDKLFLKQNSNQQNDANFDNNYLILNDIRKLPPGEEKQTKISYFHLILMIKMRLYLIIQKVHEALAILLVLIIMEQENYIGLNEEKQFSFKKLFQESLPLTKKRSKIIQNISSEQIIDFYFSPDEKNDFILTNNGLFKVSKDNEIDRIEIDSEIIENSSKDNAKICFSDEILYILTLKDKKIHKILIKQEEKKDENKKNHQYTPKNDISKKKKKRINKKLREKAKKEKKEQRKKERKENIKEKINLNSTLIDLPDYPIISMGVFENYVRILQRKSYDKREKTFILSTIDLTPNSRVNYDVLEAFENIEYNIEIKQSQCEIAIQDKNNQFKLCDSFFSKDLIFFSFEDSSFEQWMVYKDGTANFYKNSLSPYLLSFNSRLKMDNNSFMYVMEPVQDNSVCFNKMYLPETKYYIRQKNELHINYPYLQSISDIVDNCTHLIVNKEVNREITTEEYYEANKNKNNEKEEIKKVQIKDPFSFTVSPEEMSTVVQSPTAITLKMNEIKDLIKEIKDNELRQFFISLFIKMSGINLLYCTRSYYSSKNKINDIVKERFGKFRSFILDLFSIGKSIISPNSQILMKESILFTFSLAAKFLFLPDKFEILHNFMNDFVLNDENSKILLRNFSFFVFSHPSSLYVVDESLYNQLIQYENDLDIHKMFTKSIIYIVLEIKFSNKSIEIDFIENISPYIKSVFKYISHLINNKSEPLIKIEQILSYFFSIETNNDTFYSQVILDESSKLASLLYDRIKNEQGVIESDKIFQEQNQDLKTESVLKETKILESEHPYNSKTSSNPIVKEDEKIIIEDLGIIDFGPQTDLIYVMFDNKCNISKDDKIMIYCNNEETCFTKPKDFLFNQAIKFESNSLQVKLLRSKNSDINESLWGYKITFIGISVKNQFYWIPNKHLYFYNAFIMFYCHMFCDAFNSTSFTKNEKEFDLILDEKIIQGIKFEDIDNYEKNLNQNNSNDTQSKKKLKRTLTRGISRGISFDTDNDSSFSDEFKKSFLNDFIYAKDDNKTRGKLLLDILYQKTAKKNRIRLNEATKSILENERYLAACLFKQLGLINICLKFINNVVTNDNYNINEIELPIHLQSLWKKIYSLRQTLFFSYQKSKSITNQNSHSNKNKNSIKYKFKQYSEEIKRKCILLLYSDPILKFKEKENLDNDTIESVLSSIFSFVTSEVSLSNISDLIDIRRKRLSFKMKSLSSLSYFIDKNALFESSKIIFGRKITNFQFNSSKLNGLTKKEIDEYHKLYEQVFLKFIEKLFSNPSIALISKTDFIYTILFNFDDGDDDLQLKYSNIFMNIIEKNKNNQSFIHDFTNLAIIILLLSYPLKCRNNQIIDYVFLLLFSDEIDQISKRVILVFMPLLIAFMPDNQEITNKKRAYSFIEKNKKSPIIIRSSFYWIAAILNLEKNKNDEDDELFIKKVLKGIGQSFVGESCLFIDDSFDSFTNRQVAEGMISFIRLLINMKNENYLKYVHDVLMNKINHIKFNGEDNKDYIMESIGVFSSIGQELSSFEPERHIITDWNIHVDIESIIGFIPTLNKMRKLDSYRNPKKGVFTNKIIIDPKLFDLNEKEIENILQLNEAISKYFQIENKYDIEISQKEIDENVLISSFYSFLPIVMQNKNNASILMNEKNISKTLSLFKFATNNIPTNDNSILILSHYREKAILSPIYSSNSNKKENIVDKNGSFRFMKMNYGEIIYNNDNNDIIKSIKDHYNLFIATRPICSENETYFEVKINQIGNKQIFIGFIDAEDKNLNKAFGFGCQGQSQIFCRRSAYLSKSIEISNDKIMKNDLKTNNCFSIKNGDRIGCYFTKDYVYLTVNEVLTKYRLSHKSLNSYVPVISIDHDEIELEITRNVSFVDNNNKFDFLKIQSDDFFIEKDFTKVIPKSKNNYDTENLIEEPIYIGQAVFYDKTVFREKDINMETVNVVSNNLIRERENFGIVKDIEPNDQNSFVNNIKLESYNHLTLSKEILNDVDSRNITFKKTNFFNLIENRTNTKFGMNNDFNLNSLSKELKTSSDFNLISNYIRKKTIFENSKSIAVIMSRYLVFILIDYLRFIKSPLLQDEGIDSEEMNCILDSLSASIPTITSFKPRFVCEIDKDRINDYVIFKEENTQDKKGFRRSIKLPYLPPGFVKFFDLSFRVFLKKSEQFISTKFFTKLLQISIEKALSKETVSCDYLYSLISPKYKIESIAPLPNEFEIEKELNRRRLRRKERYLGFIPILLNPIPNQLPDVKCYNRTYRELSNNATCFNFLVDSIKMKWKYNLEELKEPLNFDRNYKLQFGILFLSRNLPEFLLNSSLGFIQTLLNIFQVFNNSENLFERCKEFLRSYLLEKLLSLSMKKCPLVYPFLQIIIVMLISKFGFSDSLFSKNTINASFIFESLSKKLYQMKEFPTGKNELPLLFSIYSNLIQIKINELKNDDVSSIFDKYYETNEKLFKIVDDEKASEYKSNRKDSDSLINENKKKNFRLFYLLYHYSSLLHNDNKLPYPNFLFVHDWLRQKFGGFRKAISKKDINYFKAIKIDENKEIIYKSEVLTNENDLVCSYQLFNIYEKQENKEEQEKKQKTKPCKKIVNVNKENENEKEKEKEKETEIEIKPACKVFVHQLNDDKQIEIPQSGESVIVSFPLEIIIVHENDNKNKTKDLELGDVFICNFHPSEKMQKECFIKNYDQLQNDIKQFISLEKYDNEIMEILNLENNSIKDESNNTTNNNNDNNENIINNENNGNNNIENNDNNNIEITGNTNNDESSITDEKDNNESQSKNDFTIYELQKIPKTSEISIQNIPSSIGTNVIALRCSILSTYRFLIENIMLTYTIDKNDENDDDDDENGYTYWWRKSYYSDEKAPNRYMQHIIGPAYSMCTESKFMFINKILKSETKEEYELQLIFNRFEQQKYFEKKEYSNLNSVRPLFIQFLEQIDEDSIHLLKVRGGPPFRVNLVGEGAIDGGGPGREIFSSLIVEMMNDKLGIFTSNPNRIHQYKDTNKEDLIPNKNINSENYSDEMYQLLEKRFVYAGALIAICIVSTLPQPMKLANFIWEYLTNETVSIESIYEIDEEFKQLMIKAESIEKKINSDSKMSDDEFKANFLHVFEIRDSYNKIIELVPSGSNIPVTKENLHEFIQLAKKERINEFEKELKEMKEGFDKIMIYKNIASILRPNELKLLVCGEMNCKVEQMKKIMEINTPRLKDEKINEDQMIKMFWNVMESFSVDERMLFIRFSSGNLGLPAPGLKWEENIKVYISSREEKEKDGKTLVTSSTCASEATVPFYESEEELAKMIRISLKFFGMITDGNDELNDVSLDLF